MTSSLAGAHVPVRKIATSEPGLTNPATRAVSVRLTEIAMLPLGMGRLVSASTSAAPPNFSGISCSPG